MKILYKTIFVFIASIFLCGLFGCSHKYFEKVQLMTVDDYKASLLIKQLQNEGVNVLVSKDKEGNSKIDLLIFADSVFNANSANFNPKSYTMLDTIVDLFGLYEEEVVQVVCNQGGRYNDAKSSTLALARAHQVVNYLWDEDVDASFLYADSSKRIPTGYIKIEFQNYKRQM